MSYLNLGYNLTVYEDVSDRNPNIKLTDITKSVEAVVVDSEESEKFHLQAGEQADIITTTRNVLWDATTQLQFKRPVANQDFVRIIYTGTGTAPAFRTNRAIGGDATTEVSITRLTPYVARITQTAGTAWTLSSVALGDSIKFEETTDDFTSVLSMTNQAKTYTVQSKGANYIDFLDNGECSLDSNIVLGADFEFAIRVFSPGSVKIGDTISLDGNGINPANRGQFTVADLSYDYIEVINPFGLEETVLKSTNIINVYDYLIGFIHLRSSSRLKIRMGDQTEWMTLDRLQGDAVFMGSVETHKVQAFNDGSEVVSVSVQHARVLKHL
jgi:hypothetical protein